MVLSRNATALLQRVMVVAPGCAKSLILLGCADCFKSGHRVRNRDGTSVWGCRGAVAHKVFHSRGGEKQKQSRIKNVAGKPERHLNCNQNASRRTADDG